MPPTARIAWGFVIVIFDLRLGTFDVVMDPVGWVMVLSGLAALRASSGWLTLARVGGVIGLLASFLQVFSVPGFGVEVVNGAAETAVVFGTCSVVREVVADEGVRRTAGWIRAADLALLVLAWTIAVSVQEGTNGELVVVPLVVVALGIAAWFVVFMLGLARRPEAVAL